ncbi:zinc finger protein 652-like [Sergentomyia squamirostris]
MEFSESTCRVCMKEDRKITLFTEENNLMNMINFCTQIQIIDHDRLPNGICDECEADLQVAYRFRTTFEESNEKFWKIITLMESGAEENIIFTTVVDVAEPLEDVKEEIEVPALRPDDKSPEEAAKNEVKPRRKKKLGRPPKNTKTGGKSKVIIQEMFKCRNCDKEFTTLKKLHRHESIHSSSAADDQIPDQKAKSRRVPEKLENGYRLCKFCPASFPTMKEVNTHMNEAHVDERPYLCSECGVRFVRNDYLVIHLRRHKGEKPYTCRFCGKGFPRATDLTVHERYHTGEKSHLCTVCGKGFQRAYNLLVHMRIHTGEKPYQCPYCDKSFSQGNDLKAHIRRHTGERIKCEICNEGFIQGYHLTQHKRQAHGITVRSNIGRVQKFITTPVKDEGSSDATAEDTTPHQVENIKTENELII